ncbi:MAG: hypothetical protein A2Z49_10490 [Chloroflexi bacterium RBG_19FT_COMBO_56_12]|nr:MAG: hypothetical protein A2Z49_10490 [Chloroflexi bacterium RBG_19FT_COMBO_56_12]
MIRAQVEQGVFIVYRYEGDEQVEVVTDPVVPDVREAELNLSMPVADGHLVWFKGCLPLVYLVFHP